MKKLFLLAIGALCALTLHAKKIYLDTGGSGKWNQANATFFVHAWGDGDQDLQMEQLSGDIYSVEIKDAQTSIIFVRMPNGATSLDWGKLWNKTSDQTIPDGKDLFTITEWKYSEQISKGSWSTYSGGGGGGGDCDPSIDAGKWFLKGEWNEWQATPASELTAKSGGAANTLYVTMALEAGKEYDFKVYSTCDWYGNNGTMTQAHCTDWTMSKDVDSNCHLATTIAGNYEFAFNTSDKKLSVVYPNNPKQATLYQSAVIDNNPDVMIQAFYWAHVGITSEDYTEYGDVKWNKLIDESGVLAQYFDLVWLAPSQETADYTGYLPMNYSNQGIAEDFSGHHGHSPWGTAEELKTLIKNLHKGGSKVIADIVLNHTSAGHVDEYKGDDKNWCSWTLNDFGRYGQFQIDRTWLTAEDELFATDYMEGRIDKSVTGDCGIHIEGLAPDDKYFPYGGLTDWAYQEYNSIYSRDLAHGNKKVRELSRAYLTWMRDSIGYDGFRWDFMKGISGQHLFEYLRSSAPYFSVAEVFDGNIDKQLGFMKDVNYATYMFDFPGKFTIYNEAIRPNTLNNLKGNKYTLLFGDNKKYAVSFIDNHDSFHEDGKSLYGNANTIDNRQAHQALAYLLSMPGVPCILYPYWNNYKEECKAFIKARKSAGVHSMSEIQDDWNGSGEGKNFYTALIKGTKGYIMLKLGSDCVPTDSPISSSPDGKAWKCAWANSDAGVWYTGEEWIPEVPTDVVESQKSKDDSVTKIIRNGMMYIQRGNEVYNVQGVRVQ